MSTESEEAIEKLKFNDIKSGRHTTSGILKDENGNTFNIEVKGTNYNYVEKFINYQLKKKGDGISTSVKPLSPKEQKAQEKALKGNEKSLNEAKLYTQTDWHGLSITIQVKELQKESHDPQRVHITIDPDIKTGDGNHMDFTILDQATANVKCEVSVGKVTCELFEFTDDNRTASTSRQSAKHITSSKQFDVNQLKTGSAADWNFRVTGEMDSTFTLSLDLIK